MLRKIAKESMGKADYGWLKSQFHFSFAEYYRPDNIQFGVLRVVNDDLVQPGTGFDMHPHRDMEIISYVVQGELTHRDSMGNERTLSRGHVQYMSAGTGVFHSEYNLGAEVLRLLQIWILPDRTGLQPNYGEVKFRWEDRKNQWLHMVSGMEGEAPIRIHQDANLYSLELDKGKEIDFSVKKGRQAYLVYIEGKGNVSGIMLEERDALEIVEEEMVIQAEEKSHLLVIEMKKA
ncbi:pirin family protein [Ureibacillus thermophilus]|uniref:pirin family protein n=1 Tax=Ureibacillus thermophilus TaxID=367743 RepID=UPI00360A848D